MKNQSQVAAAAATNVCVRMSKAGLDGALAIMTEGVKQRAASPPPSPPNASRSPLLASATPKITIRIKAESPTLSLDSKAPSPPMSGPPTPTPSLSSGSTHVSMGPGAEVRGMQAKPISSDSKPGTPQSGTGSGGGVEVEGSRGGPGGGRLTFFRDGKLLLELSHRSEGGTGGWIPVKSKTYWPPPSSTPHHPLRHDTPTTHSDDTSSVNSSPWAVDHIRKQSITQRPNPVLVELLSFSVCVSPSVRGLRRGVVRRRNPYKSIRGPIGSLDSLVQIERTKENHINNKSAQERRSLLEGRIQRLGERRGVKIETSVTIHGLFEKPFVTMVENVDPNFISPRKRYLRQMETDSEHSLHRKRVHAASNSVSVSSHLAEYPVASPSPSSSSSSSTSHKSAIGSQASSVYSIDSILKGETANKKGDSFLRTLLKPEPKPSVTPKPSVVKDGMNPMSPVLKTEIIDRPERMDRPELNSTPKDRNDTAHDISKLAAERLDLSRYGAPNNLASSYLLPYLADPRLMMQSLAANSGFVTPVTAPTTEMTAAAAMANVLGPYTFPAIAANPYHHLLHSGLPVPPYGSPNQALAYRLLRPPTHSHTSPYPPSPKPAVSSHGPSGQVPPPSATSPHIPHIPSPHRMSPWSLSTAHSPHKAAQSPGPSPPPQDAPLNLSKPRNSSGK